jgi:hypothetical protein
MRRLWILVALSLFACDRDVSFDRSLSQKGTFTLSHHVAWVMQDQPALVLVRPDTWAQTWVTLSDRPTEVAVAPDGQGLLVMAPEQLTWLPVLDGQVGTPVRYKVPGTFRRATFSPEGDRVVLRHGPPTEEDIVSNANELALLDLSAVPSVDNPTIRSLRAFGGEPDTVHVAPRRQISGSERQLVWVLVDGYLALLDLSAPSATERVVHLTLANDPRVVRPVALADAETADGYAAIVRAVGSDALYALSFPDVAAPDEVPRPVLNELPAGGEPIRVFARTVTDGPRIFALLGTGTTLSVVEPETAHRTAVALTSRATEVLPFEGTRDDGEPGQYALLWSKGQTVVTFVDLDLVEHRAGRALTPLSVDGPIQALLPVPGQRMAVAQVGDDVVTLLDFDARTATPLRAAGSVEGLRVADDGSAVYFAVRGRSFAVAMLDPATGRVFTETIGAQGAVYTLPALNRVLVDFHHTMGSMSVWSPFDDTVDTRRGVFLEGVLDQ